ncbi:MAG: hypothetical protein ACOC22_01770 [bacterium]
MNKKKNNRKSIYFFFIFLFAIGGVFGAEILTAIQNFGSLAIAPLNLVYMAFSFATGGSVGAIVEYGEVFLSPVVGSIENVGNIFVSIWEFIVYTIFAPMYIISLFLFFLFMQYLIFRIYLILLRIGLPLIIDGLAFISSTEKNREMPLFQSFAKNLVGVLINIGLMINRSNAEFTDYLVSKKKEVLEIVKSAKDIAV